jgi:hypothetical protein
MKKSLLILITISVACSCGTLSIEKRRYNRGFYVNWNKASKHENRQETANNTLIIKDQVADQANIDTARQLMAVAIEKEMNDDSKVLTTRSESIVMNTDAKHEHQKKNVLKDRDSAPISVKATKSYGSVRSSQQVELKKESASRSTTWFYSILASLPLMFLFKKNASRISSWATNNKRRSRGLIALLTGISALSSFALGTMSGWSTDSSAMLTSFGVLGTAAVLNSVRLGNGLNFMKNKVAYAMVGITGAFGSFGLGSRYGQSALSSMNLADGDMVIHPFWAGLLTVLIIAVILASLYFLAILACNIACNGSGILATVVFFGGAFLLICFGTYAIKYLFRREGQPTDDFMRNSIFAGILAIGLMFLFGLGIAFFG